MLLKRSFTHSVLLIFLTLFCFLNGCSNKHPLPTVIDPELLDDSYLADPFSTHTLGARFEPYVGELMPWETDDLPKVSVREVREHYVIGGRTYVEFALSKSTDCDGFCHGWRFNLALCAPLGVSSSGSVVYSASAENQFILLQTVGGELVCLIDKASADITDCAFETYVVYEDGTYHKSSATANTVMAYHQKPDQHGEFYLVEAPCEKVVVRCVPNECPALFYEVYCQRYAANSSEFVWKIPTVFGQLAVWEEQTQQT